MTLILAAVLGTVGVVLGQNPTPGVLDVGAWVSGYGALGLVTWAWLTDRIKTKKDLERSEAKLDEAEQARNDALARERETLERVVELVTTSHNLVSTMAKKVNLGADGEQ